jgi:hypothetical protein
LKLSKIIFDFFKKKGYIELELHISILSTPVVFLRKKPMSQEPRDEVKA